MFHNIMNISTSASLPDNFNHFQGYIPEPTVMPRDGGSVVSSDISKNDVLSGRGKRFNNHFGNVQFRRIVDQHQIKYQDKSNKKIEKSFIAARVVATVRYLNPTGRFLKQVKNTDVWEEIGDVEARRKARQAFRKKKKKENKRQKQETEKEIGILSYEKKPIFDGTPSSGFQRKKSDSKVSSSETNKGEPCMTTHDAPELSNFQFSCSLGPLPSFALHSYCDKSTESRESTPGSNLLSDDLDFEIDIPGAGEDLFDIFPQVRSMSPLIPSVGRLFPQVNPIAPFGHLSLNSTEAENLKGTNSIDTFSQTSCERRSSIVTTNFLDLTPEDSRKALFVW